MARLAVLVAIFGLPMAAFAQSCPSGWARAFGEGVSDPRSGYLTNSGIINTYAVFDPDGNGPVPARLVVGGYFTAAGGVSANRIAAWDGTRWAAMDQGLPDIAQPFTISALHWANESHILYAAGNIGQSGSTLVTPFVARWDGSMWTMLPPPPEIPGYHAFRVNRLHAFDPDGSGPLPEHLVAVLEDPVGYPPGLHLNDWDGFTWRSPDNWVNGVGRVTDVTVFRGSTGQPALYISGLNQDHSQYAQFVYRWDGNQLTEILRDTCTSCVFLGINALEVVNDVPGSSLYAGGNFTSIEGVPANELARWDGQAWHAVDTSTGFPSRTILDLTLFDFDGTGAKLVSADSAAAIRRWDGSTWSEPVATLWPAPPLGGQILVIPFDDGVASLFAMGSFSISNNNYTSNISRSLGTIWAPVGQSLNNSVHALAGVPNSLGSLAPGLYVGGEFYTAGNSVINSIARWDGTRWSGLGGGANNHVDALAVAVVGGTTDLYAAGKFTAAGGVIANHIARWNGSVWSGLAAGLNDRVESLTNYNHTLFAGGAFTGSGATALQHIARWDGAAWLPLQGGTNGDVQALTVFDDGAGPAVYAGGAFTTAGGVPAAHIARWRNSSWTTLDVGFNGPVLAFATYDDGTGAALYAAGHFSLSGTLAVSNIARWTGFGWAPLGPGVNDEVDSLTVFDPDGPGPGRPRLLAGGRFTPAVGQYGKYTAQWDGTSWSPLGTGVDDGSVLAMTTLDVDGPGPQLPSLFLGGDFFNVGGASSPHIAQYQACGCYANCDASATPPILNINDFQCFLNKFAANDPYANCDQSTTPPTLNINDFQCFVNAFAVGCP